MFENWTKKTPWFVLLFGILIMVAYSICDFLGFMGAFCWAYAPVLYGFLGAFSYVYFCSKWKKPGAIAVANIFVLLMGLIYQEVTADFLIVLLVITLVAEGVRAAVGYEKLNGITYATAMAGLSSFANTFRVWLFRDLSYETAVEEMDPDYANSLMNVTPVWGLILALAICLVVGFFSAELAEKAEKVS